MAGKTLFKATKYFKPFPDPSDVFAADVDQHRNHLLPLATLDLSHVNAEWRGLIHFVTPAFQTSNRWSGRHHTHHCRGLWLGFHVKNDKLQLECDFKYFKTPKTTDERKWYRMANEGFALRQQHFRENRSLHNPWAKKRKGQFNDDDRVELVENLGGHPFHSNWTESRFPLMDGTIERDSFGDEMQTVFPCTKDKRPFAYIGSMRIYHYVAENDKYTSAISGTLMLFYDHKQKIALTTVELS